MTQSRSPNGSSLRQRLFARWMAGSDEESFEMYRERKTKLLAPLRGTVVELGPGTGVNLQFIDAGVEWIGIEPNPAMHDHLRAKARALVRSVEVLDRSLDEAGPAPATVDAVVSTLVLCSVPSVPRLLARILEILKPGGTFVFIEHVVDRPLTLRRLIQKTAPFTPWRYFSDGCNPGRDIAADIRAAGFARVECEHYLQQGSGAIPWVTRPHICGLAVK